MSIRTLRFTTLRTRDRTSMLRSRSLRDCTWSRSRWSCSATGKRRYDSLQTARAGTIEVHELILIQVPPYVYPLLVLSKRLHSIFVLRCFNDCFAALFLWLAIFFFQSRLWTLGAIVYSWGLGIKMSLLLTLPSTLIILF